MKTRFVGLIAFLTILGIGLYLKFGPELLKVPEPSIPDGSVERIYPTQNNNGGASSEATTTTKTTVNESASKLEQRLAKLGWSLKDGTIITTTDAVPAPASKN